MDLKRGTGRLVAGLVVIAVGVLSLLGTLGVLDINAGEIFGWIASILLIGFGLGILVVRRLQQVFFPIVLIAIGLFILLGNLGVDAYKYSPVILILIGGGIIIGGWRRRSSSGNHDVGQSSTTTSDGELNIACTLGQANERVEAHDFSGGKVNVTMGNVNLDLRAASVKNPPAILSVSLAMSALRLRVPSDWVVNMENIVTMSESEDRRTRSGSTSDDPHLLISGKVTMSSLVVED